MINDQRAAISPLKHLKCETITERKRERRAVDLDEIRRLLGTTEAEPERFGMTGWVTILQLEVNPIKTGNRNENQTNDHGIKWL